MPASPFIPVFFISMTFTSIYRLRFESDFHVDKLPLYFLCSFCWCFHKIVWWFYFNEISNCCVFAILPVCSNLPVYYLWRFLPISRFIVPSPFIISAEICQRPRLFQPPRLLTLEIFANVPVYCTLPVYHFGRNLPASLFIPPSPSIWKSILIKKNFSKKIPFWLCSKECERVGSKDCSCDKTTFSCLSCLDSLWH